MNSNTKSRPTTSTFADNTSIAINLQSPPSFQYISYRRPPTTPRNEQSYLIINSIDNDHINDSFTQSILIDNAVQQRGFLPYDYRIKNTFESIYRQRIHLKASSQLPAIPSPNFNRTSTRFDAFGNSTSSMSKLAEQRLILHEKSNRKNPNSTAALSRQGKSFHTMSDADFARDIPNALEIILENTKRRSTIEWHLFETLKRERLQQARYRLLPLNRAPHG